MEKEDRNLIRDLVASNLTIASILRDICMKGASEPAMKTEEAVKKRYEIFRKELNK